MEQYPDSSHLAESDAQRPSAHSTAKSGSGEKAARVQAHEYATRKAGAYAAKFKTRGVRASAVGSVYLHFYTHFRAEAA